MTGLPTELVPLVSAINGGLDRLASAFEIERRFTSRAAHELRTPLAALNLRLQRVRYDGVPIDWAALDGDLAAMNRLIDGLLNLARKEAEGEQGGVAARTPRPNVDLSEAVRFAALRVAPLAQERGRVVALDLPGPLWVAGDAGGLQDMARNLIENALIHGAGRIDVLAWATVEDGQSVVILDVTDEGPGVDHALHEVLFERFRKGVQSTSGSGLGLSIVREVVRQHGGTVGFRPMSSCVVRVILPMWRMPD
jgi:two-component system sensor histidine kinase QseC